MRFSDDSFHKFTSPSLGTNDQFGSEFPDMPDHDISRRFSIDSFSQTNQNNVTMGFNRFNTISENEFEEPSINQKFLGSGENTQMAQRRLTQIQARNQQTKPHLKSSYALEQLPLGQASNSESIIKDGTKENRDVNNRMSLLNGSIVLKRKNTDDCSKSPHQKQQSNKAGRFNTQL
jgi:hypothetical protein